MKHLGLLQTAACTALFFAALPQPAVSSDEWLKTTIISFPNPIRVPGKTLPAGKYTFKLVQSPAMQLQVQIFNERQSKILATVDTSPTFRMTPPDKTTIIFYEAPVGQPEPIKAWLYPGDQYGREFIYGKSEATLIAKAARETGSTVVAQSRSIPEVKEAVTESPSAPVVSPAPAEAAPVVAEQKPQPQDSNSEPNSAAVAEPAQEATAAAAPETVTLPATASELPLLGFIGLLSLLIAAAIRIGARCRGMDLPRKADSRSK